MQAPGGATACDPNLWTSGPLGGIIMTPPLVINSKINQTHIHIHTFWSSRVVILPPSCGLSLEDTPLSPPGGRVRSAPPLPPSCGSTRRSRHPVRPTPAVQSPAAEGGSGVGSWGHCQGRSCRLRAVAVGIKVAASWWRPGAVEGRQRHKVGPAGRRAGRG